MFVLAPAATWVLLGKRLNEPQVVYVLLFLTIIGCFAFVLCLAAIGSHKKMEKEFKDREHLHKGMYVKWTRKGVELIEVE